MCDLEIKEEEKQTEEKQTEEDQLLFLAYGGMNRIKFEEEPEHILLKRLYFFGKVYENPKERQDMEEKLRKEIDEYMSELDANDNITDELFLAYCGALRYRGVEMLYAPSKREYYFCSWPRRVEMTNTLYEDYEDYWKEARRETALEVEEKLLNIETLTKSDRIKYLYFFYDLRRDHSNSMSKLYPDRVYSFLKEYYDFCLSPKVAMNIAIYCYREPGFSSLVEFWTEKCKELLINEIRYGNRESNQIFVNLLLTYQMKKIESLEEELRICNNYAFGEGMKNAEKSFESTQNSYKK